MARKVGVAQGVSGAGGQAYAEIARFNLAVLERDTYAMFRHFTLPSISPPIPAPDARRQQSQPLRRWSLAERLLPLNKNGKYSSFYFQRVDAIADAANCHFYARQMNQKTFQT